MSSLFFRRSAASKAEYHESARAAVVAAQGEAAALHHSAIYAEHFLLGVLAVDGPGQRLLVESFGLGLEDARGWVAAARQTGKVPRGGPPFDPSTRAVLDRAAETARALGDPEVTSAHLVVGVAGSGGLGADLLRQRGIDALALQRALMDLAPPGASNSLLQEGEEPAFEEAPRVRDSLSRGGEEPAPSSDSVLQAGRGAPARDRAGHLVLVLTGSADDWTAQLDRAAADGWTLVGVVPLGAEVRAILRRG